MMVHKRIHGLQESQYLAILLQKIDNRLIQAGKGLVLCVPTRVVGRTAVEDVSATIAGGVLGYAFLEGKGENANY